ncbi:MAG: adenosylhomocysteinase [Archangiaceae bacterium]|nr:adenosylhomocysteinase [Archangiaceae bacterium]
MPGINFRDLGQFLYRTPGTAAMREAKQQLIAQGVPLDRLSNERRPFEATPSSLPPDAWLTHWMDGVAHSDQFDLSTGPKFLAQALTSYFKRAADADGNVTLAQARSVLGPHGARLFELAADRAHARVWQTTASRAMPALPPNLTGRVSENPREYRLRLDAEILGASALPNKGLMRLGDEASNRALIEESSARLRRRNPQRRIAALLGQPGPAVPVMPGLEAAKAGTAKSQPFKGAQVMLVQHLYASTAGVIDAIAQAGAKPSDITVLGKPYSGSMAVAASLVDKGYRVVAGSLAQSELDDHDAHMEKLVGAEVQRMLAAKSGPILVVDDGGAVAKYVAKHCSAAEQQRFRFVEQTQRGATLVRESGVKAPVVNVAESDAKKVWESPSIGHSVFLETRKALQRLTASGATVGNGLAVVGFGAVGSAVAARFAKLPESERPNIFVYDPDPGRQEVARSMGFTVCATKAEALAHGDVTISSTGKEPMTLADYASLPKSAVLVNAASANSELHARAALSMQVWAGNAVTGLPLERRGPFVEYTLDQLSNLDTAVLDEDDHLWDTYQGRFIDLGHDVSATQIDRVVHTPVGQDLFFVNSGFVVNLTDDDDPIPPEYIGLTRGLLFGALVQAATATGEGLVPLDDALQRRVVDATEGALQARGESLLSPSFT